MCAEECCDLAPYSLGEEGHGLGIEGCDEMSLLNLLEIITYSYSYLDPFCTEGEEL